MNKSLGRELMKFIPNIESIEEDELGYVVKFRFREYGELTSFLNKLKDKEAEKRIKGEWNKNNQQNKVG